MTTTAGLIGMLNNAGIRNARIEYRVAPKDKRGWWINGRFAGPNGRTARTAIRVSPERFGRIKRQRVRKRWVLRRVWPRP